VEKLDLFFTYPPNPPNIVLKSMLYVRAIAAIAFILKLMMGKKKLNYIKSLVENKGYDSSPNLFEYLISNGVACSGILL